jgi:hypothetical protein
MNILFVALGVEKEIIVLMRFDTHSDNIIYLHALSMIDAVLYWSSKRVGAPWSQPDFLFVFHSITASRR